MQSSEVKLTKKGNTAAQTGASALDRIFAGKRSSGHKHAAITRS